MHKLESGGSEANLVIQGIIESAHERFANSVMKVHNQSAYKSAKGARSRGPVGFSARDVKKAVRALKTEHDKPLSRIEGLQCASTKMLGVVHVEHSDGKVSKLVSESGNTEIFGGGAGDFDGHKIAVEYVGDRLHSLFATKDILRETYFSDMDESDFTQNCAAIKALLAVAHDRKVIREGSGNLKYLKSMAKITSISLTESVYKPFTEKLPQGFRQYSRIIETSYDHPIDIDVADNLVVESGEELEEADHYLAKPCTRCQLKVPAIICPIENIKTKEKFEEASEFMADVTM